MSTPASDRRRDLRTVYAEGVAFSVMVGVGESYLAAFVLALGQGEILSGLVATVPLVVGGVIQLLTPWAIFRLGSRRRWAVLCAAGQAASFLPLVGGAWLGRMPAWMIFAAATSYWAWGMAIGPAWNVWVERLVPRRIRTRYFAGRTAAAHLGVLGGLVAGGILLDRFSGSDRPLLGFVVLFALAAAARGASAVMLAGQSEPQPVFAEGERGLPAVPLLRRPPTGPAARLLFYMLFLTAGVTISGPFFSARMLEHLHLSYARYMVLVSASLVVKVAVMPLLAPVAKRWGLVAVLRFAWLGIAPVPVLWLVSDSYPYLMALQMIAGASWAAHEYATFLLLFETIREGRRVGILTAYNLGNAFATVSGSLIGAWLFDANGGGAAGYVAIFAVSSACRAACIVLLLAVTDPRGAIPPTFFRPISVNAAMGIVLRPILATVRRRRPEEGEAEARGRARPVNERS
jgi:MFS family permease